MYEEDIFFSQPLETYFIKTNVEVKNKDRKRISFVVVQTLFIIDVYVVVVLAEVSSRELTIYILEEIRLAKVQQVLIDETHVVVKVMVYNRSISVLFFRPLESHEKIFIGLEIFTPVKIVEKRPLQICKA